jgi:hypothetical protein
MIAYFLVFSIFAIYAMVANKTQYQFNPKYFFINLNPFWVFNIIFLTVFIGLRYRVGGDWGTYLYYFNLYSKDFSFKDVFAVANLTEDIAYVLLNKLSDFFNFGIFGVNIVMAFILVYGLSIFCRNLSRPSLALAVSIPYMIIVVGMGYTRQAGTLGLIMYGFVCFLHQKSLRFFITILFASLIHKSALLALPLIAFLSKERALLVGFFMFLIMGLLFFFAREDIVAFYIQYITLEYESQGAFIRVFMCLVPALIFLFFRKKFNFYKNLDSLSMLLSIASLVAFALLIATPFSTAIDRISLYLLPLQLIIFSNVHSLFSYHNEKIITFLVIAYYFLVLFVWVNFAFNSGAWLPYRNLLLEENIDLDETIYF